MNIKMSELEWAAWIFVILGAVNWGLYGLFKLDFVQIIFSTSPLLMKVFYVGIGLSGAYWLYRIAMKK